MAEFPRDTIRKELEKQVDTAFPEIIRRFWEPVIEGYDVEIGTPNPVPQGLVVTLSIGPGRVYLSPKAGAPC